MHRTAGMFLHAWLIFFLSFQFRVLAKVLAILVVWKLSDYERVHHEVFGVEDATDLSYWNIAVRNGAHNFFNRTQPNYTTAVFPQGDLTLEKLSGWQFRYRISDNQRYHSYRVTFGEPRPSKGKKEFYIGWTMNNTDGLMRPTIQMRFW